MQAIELLSQLCRMLSAETVSVDQVSGILGQVLPAEDPDEDVTVRPADPAFSEAIIMRDEAGGDPEMVELLVSESAVIKLSWLVKAFGKYDELPRLHKNRPSRVMFSVDDPDQPFTCDILADVAPRGSSLKRGTVSKVLLRREIRL